jgi:diphosphomevalonate decarboxylase
MIEAIYKVAPNIALIKYWGKLNVDLNIPLNGSLSLTLDENDIYTIFHL